MIVIDIGCGRYGGDYSIERLVDEFHPSVLYGFDPNSAALPDIAGIGKTLVELYRKAAWTYGGEIGFLEDGLNSCLTDREDAPKVPCFDLVIFIRSLPANEEIVLKIDAEGSEFKLLEHLIATRTDELLKLVWVEWHEKGIEDAAVRRAASEAEIDCEIAEWRW